MKTPTMGCCAALTCALPVPLAQVKLPDTASPLPLMAVPGLLLLGWAITLRLVGKRLGRGRIERGSRGFIRCGALCIFITASGLLAQSPAPVNLGVDVICTAPNTPVGCGVGSAAGDYVILSGAAITDVPSSVITGNIGASPISGSAIGVPCSEVTGNVFEVDAGYIAGVCTNITPNDGGIAGPPQTGLLAATSFIGAGGSAYMDAASRAPTFPVNLYGGDLTGRTLFAGVYKWSTDVNVNPLGLAGGAVTLSGGPNDVWIFQIAGNLTLGAPAGAGTVILSPGVQANNIFWQVGGAAGAKLYSASVLYGTVLSATAVVMQAGATLTGRALGPTGVTLISNTITSPGPLTGGLPLVVAPTVTSTVPTPSGVVGVSVSSPLTATFSEIMDPTTITPAGTFTLQIGLTTVPGTVTYPAGGVTATFTPAILPLLSGTSYTATITTAARDLAGVALAANHVWTFTTAPGAPPPVVPPAPTLPFVISTVPSNQATGVPTGNALAAIFSEVMNPLTINATSFTLTQGATVVPGNVTYVGRTATFTPANSLAANTVFRATISGAVSDLAGNALGFNYVWTFTTGANPDTTPPTVISTAPASGAILVTISANLAADFSEFMNPLTINTLSFILRQGTIPVPGTVTYTGLSATFTPAGNLTPNTLYMATITRQATDLAGNPLPTDYSWSFTTGASAGQTPVCLADFAVLAGSAIISSGPTTVTGDMGVSPGATVIGFPAGTLNGTMHAGDQVAAQAIVDLTAAYGDAAARSVGPLAVAGDLGGQTFTAGLYRSASSLQISSGDVTLDAKGDVNAVFIFQMASTLTTSQNSRIILAGGAQAFNVFWQVGTSATLGIDSVFNGSILADQSITMGGYATLAGRLAARTGTVTLTSNTITSPPPYIVLGGIYNAASWAGPVAAGSLAAVFGNNLASSLTSARSYPLLTTLGGTSFQIGSESAPIYMTSCNQTNLQIPWESAGQTQLPVVATAGGLVSLSRPATIAPFAPGIFSLNQLGSGQGAVEIAPTNELAAPLGTGARPVQRGEYIAIFCTGLGAVSNQPATGAPALSNPLSITASQPIVTIGGVAAQVTYSGLAPGFAGLYQVNAMVPAAALSGNSVNLVISIGGVQSNTVTIAVQ